MRGARTVSLSSRRVAAGILLTAAAGGLLAGCGTMPHGPTYTDAELKAICERTGGWWRGSLIEGYCERQSAFLRESP